MSDKVLLTVGQMTAKKFIGSLLIRYISRVLVMGEELVFIFLIAKELNAISYGIYSQIMATSLLLVPLLLMGLRESSVRYLAAKEDKNERNKSFFSMLWIIWVAFLFVFIISHLHRENLSVAIFNNRNLSNYIDLMFLLLFSFINFRFILNYYRAMNEIIKYSVIEIIKSFVEVGIVILIIHYSSQLQLSMLFMGLIAVEGMLAFVMLVDITRKVGVSFVHPKIVFPLLMFGLPMVPSEILSWITDASDKYIIVHFLDLRNVGIYSASYKIGQISFFCVTPIVFVLFPHLTKLWEQAKINKVKNFIQGSIKLYLIISIPIITGIYQLSPFILRIVASEEFAINKVIVLMILLGFLLLGMSKIYQLVIYLKEKTKYFVPVYAGAAALNVIINFILIPKIGILGASISTLASFLMIFLANCYISQRFLVLGFDLAFLLKILASSFVMVIAISLFKPANITDLVLVGFFGAVIYILSIFVLKALSQKELNLVKSFFMLKGA